LVYTTDDLRSPPIVSIHFYSHATSENRRSTTPVEKVGLAYRRSTARVIDLVYYHEKSVKEVAEIVGIAEATVKTRMFYARKKLVDLVEAA
jgi:DNA-directed RNA polymerase specialized sigma24 family protein